MPPVQTRHIRSVTVLLEEDMVLAIAVRHAVRLIGPSLRGHTVITGTAEVLRICLHRHIKIDLVLRRAHRNVTHRPDTRVYTHLINDTVEIIEVEHAVHHRIVDTAADEEVLLSHRSVVHTSRTGYLYAVVVEMNLLVITVYRSYQMVPLIPP